MRSYWVKIIGGAVLIFAVGMIIRTMVHKVRRGVEYVSNGTGPISWPVFFLPFDLDGRRLGRLRDVTIYRDSTRNPSSVAASVSLADTVSEDELARCIIALVPDSAGNINPLHFRCLSGSDTAGRNLAQFGVLRVRSSRDTFPLFAPADKVGALRSEWGHGMSSADSSRRAMNDSLRDAVHSQIESTLDRAQQTAESLRGTLPHQ